MRGRFVEGLARISHSSKPSRILAKARDVNLISAFELAEFEWKSVFCADMSREECDFRQLSED